jgi:hypothetical protein
MRLLWLLVLALIVPATALADPDLDRLAAEADEATAKGFSQRAIQAYHELLRRAPDDPRACAWALEASHAVASIGLHHDQLVEFLAAADVAMRAKKDPACTDRVVQRLRDFAMMWRSADLHYDEYMADARRLDEAAARLAGEVFFIDGEPCPAGLWARPDKDKPRTFVVLVKVRNRRRVATVTCTDQVGADKLPGRVTVAFGPAKSVITGHDEHGRFVWHWEALAAPVHSSSGISSIRFVVKDIDLFMPQVGGDHDTDYFLDGRLLKAKILGSW